MPLPHSADTVVRPGLRELLLVLAVWLGALASLQLAAPAPPVPQADSLRYLHYVVNLMDHGVFGLANESGEVPPGRANTPLYPAFAAAVLAAAGRTASELRCLFGAEAARCVALLAPLLRVQLVVAAAGLTCIWLTGLCVLGTRRAAWLAALFALLSGQPGEFAGQLLTENLSLPLFALLTLALCGVRTAGPRWYAVLGVTLGLLGLTRPELLYLGVGVLGVQCLRAVSAGAGERMRAWRAGALLLAGMLASVGPWLYRNHATFGDVSLTSTYAGRTLAQRVQYNRMSNGERACALVYWLPDFGDSLARRMLPASCIQRLDFGPGSYYADSAAHYRRRVAEAGGEATVMRHLLHEDVLAQPLQHALSTVVLAWRGLFVGKLWGLVAVVAFCTVLTTRPELRRPLLILSAPAWFMLLLYATVSVAIPRYAVCFVPVFSLALAALVTRRSSARLARSAHARRGG